MIPALSYFEMRENLAGDIRRGLVQPTPEALTDRIASAVLVDRAEAAECAERFLRDINRGLGR